MKDDLTFGATLLASLAAMVVTVWGAASQPQRTDVAAAVVHAGDTAERKANKRDKDCATTVAAAPASAE